jgi:hypothetical protein
VSETPANTGTSPPVASPPNRRLGRRRRLGFVALTIALVFVFAEIASAIGIYFSLGNGEDFEALAKRQERLSRAPRGKDESGVVVHPYTGWAMNPQISDGDEVLGKKIPVNRLGFIDDQESLQKRGPDRLIIGVTGGSVAWQLTVAADNVIRRAIQQSPRFRNREIVILRIGQSGYKQPQQLMTVNWLMSLGGEFDAIVNLDGYNEVVLSIYENYDRKIHTAYPRAWNARMLELIDPRESADRMRLLEIDAHRQQLARGVRIAPWRWSFSASALWLLRDGLAAHDKREVTKRLFDKRASRAGVGFAKSGPIEDLANSDAALMRAVDIWERSSLQLHRLLTASDVVYLHALQPNQHHAGSKPLSKEEDELIHFVTDTQAARDGFPLLVERGKSIEAAGVEFLDLTQIFENEPGTMYIDSCCHMNEEANRRLAVAIGSRLRELLESE